MGVEGVIPSGASAPGPAPIRSPSSRAGPDKDQKRETVQSVHAAVAPQQEASAKKAERPERAVLVKSGPKRAGTRLSVDAQTNRIIAQIVDETNQVIKQIPPEELLKIVAQTRKMQARLFDENA